MKFALLVAVVIVTLSSLPFVWRRTETAAEENLAHLDSTSPTTIHAVHARLISNLDARKVDEGAAVLLETWDAFEAGDGTIIPAGSRVTGHLTQVLHQDTEQPVSNLRLVFDRADLTGGRTIRFHSAAATLTTNLDATGMPTSLHPYHLNTGTPLLLGISTHPPSRIAR